MSHPKRLNFWLYFLFKTHNRTNIFENIFTNFYFKIYISKYIFNFLYFQTPIYRTKNSQQFLSMSYNPVYLIKKNYFSIPYNPSYGNKKYQQFNFS